MKIKTHPMRRIVGVLFLLNVVTAFAQSPARPPVPKTTDELRQQIEKIMQDTHTPGVAVAVVRKDGPEWVAGFGLADLAAKNPVTPDTLFRIEGISQVFVSLSALKLQEEGKLSLQDTLRSRAPDLDFTNPWEATDPIRIVNLLEHTTGWDVAWRRDYTREPAQDETLKEGLAYSRESRTSRWKPGTRFSYSHAGPPAAAYAIEKITGQRFEDYVAQNWFKPLGMGTASYFVTSEVESRLAKFYGYNRQTPYRPVWQSVLRPTNSVYASAKEMANLVQFYLNRGSFGGVQLLPSSAIERMEEPRTTYAAREGLKQGYGLANHPITGRDWVFHGHRGYDTGVLSMLAYLPEAGVGYVFMINAEKYDALPQIDGLIRSYLTQNLPRPAALPVAAVRGEMVQEYSGWYEHISGGERRAHAIGRFFERIRVQPLPNGLSVQTGVPQFRGPVRAYVPVTDRIFRRSPDGVPSLALLAEKSEGTLVSLNGETYRRIPAWLPWLEGTVVVLAALLMLSSLVFALVWLPRKLLGRMRSVECISVRAMPVLATLSLVGRYQLHRLPSADTISPFGRLTPWSVGQYMLNWGFAVFAVLGVLLALRFRNRPIRRLVWWHAFAASLLMTVVAVYLCYWGFISLKFPWA